MNNKLIGISIGIVAAVAFLVAGYFYVWNKSASERDTYWQLKLANAKHTTDSIWVPSKPDTVRVMIPSKPLAPDYRQKVDSAFSAGIARGADSLRRWVNFLAQPLDTLHVFPSRDTLYDFYAPLTHDWHPSLHLAPRLAVYDTVWYPLPPVTKNATFTQVVTGGVVGAVLVELFRAFVLRKP